MQSGKNKYISGDEEKLVENLLNFRYGRLKICPGCKRETKFHRLKKQSAYSCQFCGHHLRLLAGTVFHKSRIPLTKWLRVFYLYKKTYGKITGEELRKALGVSYKTAWRMKKLARKFFTEKKDPLYAYLSRNI